jgi:hypothetical protein
VVKLNYREFMTANEAKVIEVITGIEPTLDPQGKPFQAVCTAMNWTTAQTEQFVRELQLRNLLVLRLSGGEGLRFEAGNAWWEKPGTEE